MIDTLMSHDRHRFLVHKLLKSSIRTCESKALFALMPTVSQWRVMVVYYSGKCCRWLWLYL